MDAGDKQRKRQTKSHYPWSVHSLERTQTMVVDRGMKKGKQGYELLKDGREIPTI